MKHMVSYRVKPERVAENEAAIRRVYADLREAAPAGLRYTTFKEGDDTRFVHIVSHEAADGRNALTSLPAVQAFVDGVKDRCSEPPQRVDLTEIGSYGFFGP